MIKKLIFLLPVLFMLPACYNTYDGIETDQPANLIPRDTIVLILADVEIAESALRQMQNMGQEISSMKEAYYNNIFSKYSISMARFDSSMVFYRQDPEIIDKIYEDVITRLSMMESEIKME